MSPATTEKHKQELLALRTRLRTEIGDLVERAPDSVNAPGEVSTLPTHLADRAAEGFDTEMTLVHKEEDLLGLVESALARIEEGSYGKCTNCGGKIAAARLNALPYTPFCIECAQKGASPSRPR